MPHNLVFYDSTGNPFGDSDKPRYDDLAESAGVAPDNATTTPSIATTLNFHYFGLKLLDPLDSPAQLFEKSPTDTLTTISTPQSPLLTPLTTCHNRHLHGCH